MGAETGGGGWLRVEGVRAKRGTHLCPPTSTLQLPIHPSILGSA